MPQVPRCNFREQWGVDKWQHHVRLSKPALIADSPLLGDTSSKVRRVWAQTATVSFRMPASTKGVTR